MTSDEIAGRLADLYDENQIKTQITAFKLGDSINFMFSGSNRDMLNTAIQIVEQLTITCAEDCVKEGLNPDIALKMTKDLVRKMLANMLANVANVYREEREAQDAVKAAEAEMNKGTNNE